MNGKAVTRMQAEYFWQGNDIQTEANQFMIRLVHLPEQLDLEEMTNPFHKRMSVIVGRVIEGDADLKERLLQRLVHFPLFLPLYLSSDNPFTYHHGILIVLDCPFRKDGSIRHLRKGCHPAWESFSLQL
jgi:hypothetical protein